MKMGPGTFWGLFLILVGTALILKTFFRIDIPVFKIVLALFFILIGIKIIFGNFRFHKFRGDENDVIFGEIKVLAEDLKHDEYNIIFGKGEFDLRRLNLSTKGTTYLKIACVFGNANVVLDEDIPVKITFESVFSGGEFPNGNSSAFGNSTYISPNYDPSQPHLNLRVEMVFGGCKIKQY